MMRRTFSGALVLACFAGAIGAGESNWKKFSPTAGRYSILMPGTPQEQTLELPTPVGNAEQNVAIVENAGTCFYVSYTDYPVSAARFELDELLENGKKGVIAHLGGNILREKTITVDGHEGHEMLLQGYVDGQKVFVRMQRFLIGKRLYILQTLGTTEEVVTGASANKFLGSFKLIRQL